MCSGCAQSGRKECDDYVSDHRQIKVVWVVQRWGGDRDESVGRLCYGCQEARPCCRQQSMVRLLSLFLLLTLIDSPPSSSFRLSQPHLSLPPTRPTTSFTLCVVRSTSFARVRFFSRSSTLTAAQQTTDYQDPTSPPSHKHQQHHQHHVT